MYSPVSRPCRHVYKIRFRYSSTLSPPRYNWRAFLESPEKYQSSVDARKVKLDQIGQVSELAGLRDALLEAQNSRIVLATKRNSQARAGRGAVDPESIAAARELKRQIQAADVAVKELEQKWAQALDSFPNDIEPKTLEITGEFEEIDRLGEGDLLPADPSRDHVTIGTELGILDIASASRASGTGFYYLCGAGALLEQALVSFASDTLRSAGFKLVSPPCVVREEFATACGFRPRDQNGETQIYGVRGGGGAGVSALALAGTAEIPLAAQLAHSSINFGKKSSIKHAGISRSFRAEAGAGGVDTRGLYRVHEFTKVEMFVWSKPDLGLSSHILDEELLEMQKKIVKLLELPARVIKIGPSDLGAPAYAKYDIEAWMPGRGKFGEISSTSNCLDFQSRRLHSIDAETGEYVHTLNGTALAVPRVIIALIENGWVPEQRIIKLPKALHSLMGSDHIAAENIPEQKP